MNLSLSALVFLAWVSVASVFPQDPAGVDVIDRAIFRTYQDGEELVLYITLFNHEEIGTIKIDEYLDGEWETVCIWNPKNLGDEFMLFDLISVLSIFDLGGTVQVSWIDSIGYQEGMVSFYILYDYVLGEWEEGWVD